MTKRISNKKRIQELLDLLLRKAYEFKKYQYQKKVTNVEKKIIEETRENLEIIRFKNWLKDTYKIENLKEMQKEHVLEYALQYQVWSVRKNQKSYATKQIYRKSALEFAKFLAWQYRAMDYRKITDKHIDSFVKYELEHGMALETVQKKLYGIYYHYELLHGYSILKPIKEVLQNV